MLGFVGFILGFVGLQWNQAQSLESRANAIGWDVDVPVFGHDGFETQVADSERLKSDVKEIEEKHGITLGFPYSESMLDGLDEKLKKMSEAGMDLSTIDFSTIDFSKIDVEKWTTIKSLLKVKKIPAGTFTMGCTSEQGSDCSDSESPSHKVTLTRDFYIMESEVTQALYKTVMGSNPSNFESANRPVETVSWFDVVGFANRLSELDGRLPCYSISGIDVKWSNKDCTGWRLPTEAEWEYAARGGQSYKYAGSHSVGDVAWYGDNSNSETHDVCGKSRNGYGLCDMSGNVWEWVWDWYGNYSSNKGTDLVGPVSGPYRVYRGGSWRNYARFTRVSYRYVNDPTYRLRYLGVRLSRFTP